MLNEPVGLSVSSLNNLGSRQQVKDQRKYKVKNKKAKKEELINNLQCVFHPGGEGIPLYRLYRYVLRQSVCFFSCSGLKQGMVCALQSLIGYVFQKNQLPLHHLSITPFPFQCLCQLPCICHNSLSRGPFTRWAPGLQV